MHPVGTFRSTGEQSRQVFDILELQEIYIQLLVLASPGHEKTSVIC
jgi:hypothetical protein